MMQPLLQYNLHCQADHASAHAFRYVQAVESHYYVSCVGLLQGLWQVRNWQVGNMSLVAEFLCVIELPGPIGDIAVLHGGDIAVSRHATKPAG
jgi:hypothetical protein